MGRVDQAKTRKNGKGHQGEVTERKKKIQSTAGYTLFQTELWVTFGTSRK